ncbi:MAG: gluconolaconase [Streptosporangiales bacterium]|nr:gluconolaconase [Streptosporangiales bacterium]
MPRSARADAIAGPGKDLPRERTAGRLEVMATLDGPIVTGLTVSREGRIFVNFPRWGDEVPFTVAELVDGEPVAYPNRRINRPRPDRPEQSLISVQSVVVDPDDRLWLLDTGRIEFGEPTYGGPKLVGVDLERDEVFQKILFPTDVALPTTYLNDIRFDLRRGQGGLAFITDSSDTGPNGIIVVDLDSGRSWRKLHEHPSTKAEPNFLPLVEGRPLLNRPPDGTPTHMAVGADGIAMGADGERLFYCPLSGRRLYSVSVDALADESASEDEVAGTVQDLGDKGGAADGLESDAQGRVYLTNYEHNALLRRSHDGAYETLVHDPRMLWPDTLSLARDRHLYVTANQLNRQPSFNGGRDLRVMPYVVFRTPVDADPVLLR